MLSRCAALLAAVSVVTLCGCGGGGGGAGSPGGGAVTPPPPTTAYDGTSGGNFTNWAAVQPSTPVTVTGLGREVTYTSVSDGIRPVPAFSGQVGAPNMTATITYDAERRYPTIQFNDGSQTLSLTGTDFFSANTQFLDSGLGIQAWDVAPRNWSNAYLHAILVEPQAQGWDYQTFGVWSTSQNLGAANESGTFASYSLGKTTGGAAIPTSGSATFNGKVAGYYFIDGVRNMVGANMSLNVNFAGRSAAFSSQDLRNSNPGLVYSGTAISGTLTYGSQSNALTGTLTTTNGLSGQAAAQFYGPSAQEVGGTFILAPTTGGDRVIAGFGAKR